MEQSSPALDNLKSTVTTTLTLISQLKHSAPSSRDASVDALDLAYDAASLVRAHATKLSLLIINKPFTPSAVTTVLRELVSGPLPGIASSIEICNAKYTKAMSSELTYCANRVLKELEVFIQAIPLDGNILTDDQKNGTADGKGSLTSTGVIWAACDSVMELKTMGVSGLMVMKAEEYRDMLGDALVELQEWGAEESDVEDNGSGEDDAQAAVDQMFSQRHIPTDDPDQIRPRLEAAQKRLRLLILMYQAVVKRRLKTLPKLPELDGADSGIVFCLDEVLDALKKIPDVTDELASAFYELDRKKIDERMDQCFFAGFAIAELLIKDWQGQNDSFSTWVSFLDQNSNLAHIRPGSQFSTCVEERSVTTQMLETSAWIRMVLAMRWTINQTAEAVLMLCDCTSTSQVTEPCLAILSHVSYRANIAVR